MQNKVKMKVLICQILGLDSGTFFMLQVMFSCPAAVTSESEKQLRAAPDEYLKFWVSYKC